MTIDFAVLKSSSVGRHLLEKFQQEAAASQVEFSPNTQESIEDIKLRNGNYLEHLVVRWSVNGDPRESFVRPFVAAGGTFTQRPNDEGRTSAMVAVSMDQYGPTTQDIVKAGATFTDRRDNFDWSAETYVCNFATPSVIDAFAEGGGRITDDKYRVLDHRYPEGKTAEEIFFGRVRDLREKQSWNRGAASETALLQAFGTLLARKRFDEFQAAKQPHAYGPITEPQRPADVYASDTKVPELHKV